MKDVAEEYVLKLEDGEFQEHTQDKAWIAVSSLSKQLTRRLPPCLVQPTPEKQKTKKSKKGTNSS